MPAAGATSAQTSRERIARRQQSPACWPVTVTKPKLRIEAPLACASRSMTTTAQAAARRGQGMGEPDDAGADDGEVEAGLRHRLRQACVRPQEPRDGSSVDAADDGEGEEDQHAIAAAGAMSPASSMFSTATAASVVSGE